MNHTSFSPGTWTSFMASVLAAPCSHQLMVRTGLLVTVFSRHDIVIRCCTPSVALVPARGKKQKFGGFTRDPFKTFQKKLAKKEAQRTEKVPLMSRERGERMLQYPYTVTSLGTCYISLVICIYSLPCSLHVHRRTSGQLCSFGEARKSSVVYSSGEHL